MSYNKHIWKKGDKITAEKLNNIEEGIEQGNNSTILDHYKPTYEFNFTISSDDGGGYIATASDESTYANIKAAFAITNNVIFIIDVLGQKYRILASDDANYIYASTVVHNDVPWHSPILIQLEIKYDNTLTPIIDFLATVNS